MGTPEDLQAKSWRKRNPNGCNYSRGNWGVHDMKPLAAKKMHTMAKEAHKCNTSMYEGTRKKKLWKEQKKIAATGR